MAFSDSKQDARTRLAANRAGVHATILINFSIGQEQQGSRPLHKDKTSIKTERQGRLPIRKQRYGVNSPDANFSDPYINENEAPP
jgi:hypothetical protein